MYLQHFHLQTSPFGLTPDTHFFCQSSQHTGALNTANVCLNQGEGFIKITGEVGSGKTLLCRLLLNQLDSEKFLTAYLPNPNVDAKELPFILAKEIGLDIPSEGKSIHEIQEMLFRYLAEINRSGKTVVLLIDEAQSMPAETLEALRLLTNLEAETHKLLQVVLVGQPEFDDRLDLPQLRQLKQRIAFSYYLKPLSYAEMLGYMRHRLTIAGHTQGNLFTDKALRLIFRYSHGLPRLINILSHKALLAAYGLGLPAVTAQCVKLAKKDTAFAALHARNTPLAKKILGKIRALLRPKPKWRGLS